MTTIDYFLDPDVDDSTEVASHSLTGSIATAASVTLMVPSHWNGWKCYAVATMVGAGGDANSDVSVDLEIDGTVQQRLLGVHIPSGEGRALSVVGHRTGISTTGSRTVALRADNASTTSGVLEYITLYACAKRTA